MIGRKFESQKERYKIGVMAGLLAGACLVTYYFHIFLKTGTVVTHIFYIPIILAAVWWKRKGLIVALFSSAFLIFSHISLRPDVATVNDYFRALMFIVIAFVVAKLSEHITREEEELRAANQQLAAEEAELRKMHNFLERLIDYANASIIVWDPKLRITRFNRAFERLTGYTADEVIGQKLNILFPKASRDESLRNIKRTLSGEYWESVEIPVLRKDGDIRVALWNSANIYAEDDTTLLATIAQGQDITERKRAEQQLRAANQQLRASEQQLRAANQQLRATEQQLRAANQQLKASEQQLRAANQQLRAEVTERKRAEERLLDYQSQLKSLASQLTLAEEHERHRIATELHDQIGQLLIISKLNLDTVRNSGSAADIAKALNEADRNIEQIIQNLRSLTFELSSPLLYELGLEKAVAEWLTEKIRKKHRINTEFEDDGQHKPLDDDLRALLFRDVRELLTNVVRHAQAKWVKVSIRKVESRICVTVEDNGWGFDPEKITATATKTGKFGLFSIRERLKQLGGSIEIESAPGYGTCITLCAPLKQETKNLN